MRCVAALVVLLCGATASAQPDLDTDAAKALFIRGTAQYEMRHYREALVSFEQAKSIKPLPAFDYNIGRCHEQLREWSEAVAAYERYVDADPPPPDAPEVRVHIGELRRHIEPPPPVAAPPVAAPPVAAPPVAAPPVAAPVAPMAARHRGRAKVIAGGVVGGAGVVLLALGGVFASDGDKQADALTAADRANRPFDPSLERALGRDRAAEIALFTVGAAAAATGAVLVIVGVRADRRAPAYAWSRP